MIKKLLKSTSVYKRWNTYKRNISTAEENNKVIEDWKAKGKPSPPPQIIKRLAIKEYAKKNSIRVFIETGTYLGETLDYLKPFFRKLISIELDEKLHKKAQ